MSIFTRVCDIINSNINAMLDSAEDPEKLLNHMIQEMEDTLVDLKASCASVIAGKRSLQRRVERFTTKQRLWRKRAQLALERKRDDLAKEALREKHRLNEMIETLNKEVAEHKDIVDKYRGDILMIEGKLASARNKQHTLAQRHTLSRQAMRRREDIHKMDTIESISGFDDINDRIERMEREAEFMTIRGKSRLEEAFEDLIIEEQLDQELDAMRTERRKQETEAA